MDPISIVGLVASTIAIVQAADRIGGLLGQLKPLFEAPREVEQLIKDVKSLKSLVVNVSEAAKEMDRSSILPAEKIETLKSFVDEAEDILSELDRLIDSFKKPLTGIESKLKVHRGTWARRVGEVENLRNRMRDLRLSVAVELSTLHIFAVIRSNQSLDQITIQAGQLLTEHSTTQRFLLQEFPENRNILCQQLENQQSVSNRSVPRVADSESDFVNEDSVVCESPAVILRNLRKEIESKYACSQWCRCRCHVPYQTDISTKWIGSVGLQISGMPYVNGSCNIEKCKKRSKTRLQVHLGFPKWLVSRVITISVLCNSFTQPQFHFRTLRVRQGGDQIFVHVRTGNLERVKNLFAEGEASVLDVDENNKSALTLAISECRYPIIVFLLEQGSDPFLEDKYKLTPFLLAWQIYTIIKTPITKQMISELFPKDFDDERCNCGMSKLQLMITEQVEGNVEEEIELTRNDIDHQDSLGKTALLWAILGGKTGIAKSLLSHGADVALPDLAGRSPLHAAAMFDSGSITLLLDAGASPHTRQKSGETPLHFAARACLRDPLPYMSKLLDAGADINAQNHGRLTPLVYACEKKNNAAAIECLIQQGADINLPNNDDDFPISIAIYWKHASYVEMLLEAGAECKGTTYNGNVLHYVAHRGNIETLRIFIRWRARLIGLDVNLKNKYDRTPVEYAQWRNDVSWEWAEAFDELISAILEDQDTAADEAEGTEMSGVERVTFDDADDSWGEFENSGPGTEGNDERFGVKNFSREGDGYDIFEDALETQDTVGIRGSGSSLDC
ncbi:hypothetical protein ONS96_014824 [Cadophora gregata f. sp. sojae]|nr:hypothetical protein ONS96_014824 [Cadophora gregata f. sp. sojae]